MLYPNISKSYLWYNINLLLAYNYFVINKLINQYIKKQDSHFIKI